MSNFGFRMMEFLFRFRDIFTPPRNTLQEVLIEPGSYVLDFGCGPGSYSIACSEMVGTEGKVFALDIHPLAIESLQNRISKMRLTNIKTILSSCETGLDDNSIDIILLYDVFHYLKKRYDVQKELYRVLKPNGVLSFSDHHMEEENIILGMTEKGFFKLAKSKEKTYSFVKVW
ncbi:MAG: class I SAM-dependent methyltransferase [Halobacteriota archaeon]|nr:class I SAM-dependent methyltransferase [Halobacteriota archaeon]